MGWTAPVVVMMEEQRVAWRLIVQVILCDHMYLGGLTI
jgi:hypothetical protein